MTEGINETLLGTRLACSHLKRYYDPVLRLCKKCGMTDEERFKKVPLITTDDEASDVAERMTKKLNFKDFRIKLTGEWIHPGMILPKFDKDVGVIGHQDVGFKPTPSPGTISWREIKPIPDEVGCQIILTTGEHLGECTGTCRD